MCIYKRYSDQSKCIYFMIKDEKSSQYNKKEIQ